MGTGTPGEEKERCQMVQKLIEKFKELYGAIQGSRMDQLSKGSDVGF